MRDRFTKPPVEPTLGQLAMPKSSAAKRKRRHWAAGPARWSCRQPHRPHPRRSRSGSRRPTGSLALELPGDGVIVDCDHDHVEVGWLVYAGLGDDEALRCVAVVDGDQLARIDDDVYFSPELELHGDVDKSICIAREAALSALADVLACDGRGVAGSLSRRRSSLERRPRQVADDLAQQRPAACPCARQPRLRGIQPGPRRGNADAI